MINTKLHIFHYILKLNLRQLKTEKNSYDLTKFELSYSKFARDLHSAQTQTQILKKLKTQTQIFRCKCLKPPEKFHKIPNGSR
jgi:hypothetical protein